MRKKTKKVPPLKKALQAFAETAAPALDGLSREKAAPRTADSEAALQSLRSSANALNQAIDERLDALRKRLEHHQPDSCSNTKVRRIIAPFGDEACVLLANLLGDAEPLPVRRMAAHCIALLGVSGSGAVPALIQAFKASDRCLKSCAATALQHIGSDARAALPSLAESLMDDDFSWNHRAINALVAIAPHDKLTITALAGNLRSKHALTRILALHALDRIGPIAISICPTLLDELERFGKTEENLPEDAIAILQRLRAGSP